MADFNARTAVLSDTLEFDAYLDPDYQEISGDQNYLPIPQNQDKVVESWSKIIITVKLQIIVANGRFHKDTQGNFTDLV